MSTKFYVYGGGRWRELDLNTGRVSGWAKSARIVVARSGRLECPRTAPVLHALRALAAGEASRARDGPRLPHTRWEEKQCQSQRHNHNIPCQHCCHHRYTAVENVCKHVPSMPSVQPKHVQPSMYQGAQPSTRALNTDEIFDKLRNECVNQPEVSPILTQVRSPQKRTTRIPSVSKGQSHSAAHRQKRQRVSSSSSIELVSNVVRNEIDQQKRGKHKGLEKEKKKPERRGRPPRRAFTNILGIVASAVPVTNPNTAPPLGTISSKWNITTSNNTSVMRPNGDISNSQRALGPRNIAETSKVLTTTNEDSQSTSDESDANTACNESERSSDEQSQQSTETSAILACALHRGGHVAATGQRQRETPAATAKVCKELVIEESDVIALRGFLRRSAPEVSLSRFDTDDEYKRGIFYGIHPLVSLERSERIQQILFGNDDITLRDFASQLGLRCISDEPPRVETNRTIAKASRPKKQPDRYSEVLSRPTKSPVKKLITSAKTLTRKKSLSNSPMTLKATARKNGGSQSSSVTKTTSSAKSVSKLLPSIKPKTHNNSDLSARPKKVSREQVLSKIFKPSKTNGHKKMSKPSALTETINCVKVAPNPPAPETTVSENGVSSKVVVSLSNNDSVPKFGKVLKQRTTSPRRGQPRSKPNSVKPIYKISKEYSPSEDMAIVSWVSGEKRARLVNGNRIWRELQGQYENLTGLWRTWQSLRNRYLRYILPSLSSLAVTPARAARLRAAAATGEIKSRRQPVRRNSIFATPGVRGAWSRRPRLSTESHTSPQPPHDGDERESSSPKTASQRERSKSSSSSSSSSSASGRYPALRYSEVTRRFARRQKARYSKESSAEPRAHSPLPAAPSTRTRRLFNPKAAL